MSRSSFSRRLRRSGSRRRMCWRIDLLPPRTLRGLRLGASATAVAVALLANPMPAFGVDECGSIAPGGTATCISAGNPYADGITYTVDDLTIVLESGVAVATDAAGEDGVSTVAGGALVVDAIAGSVITTVGDHSEGVYAYSSDGAVTVSVADVTTTGLAAEGVDARSLGAGADGAVSVTATGTISTAGNFAYGARAFSSGGPVTVNVAGVTTTGDFAAGVSALSTGTGAYGAVSVTATGVLSTGGFASVGVLAIGTGGPVTVSVAGVTTAGDFAAGVYAQSSGTGADGVVSVTATGPISTAGYEAEGVFATSSDGPVTVSVAGVTTGGDKAEGVYAYSSDGAVTVSVADVTTTGLAAEGVDARSLGAGADGAVSVTATGTISTAGNFAYGARAFSSGGPVTVNVAGVTTTGDFAAGVSALSTGTGAYGAVSVTATGVLSTGGFASVGVLAIGTGGPVTVSVAGVTTAGDFAAGVYAQSSGTGADGVVSVTATGPISTAGYEAEGVFATSSDGPVTVSVAGVTTTGDYAEGVYAASAGTGANGAISVTATGTISTMGYKADGVYAGSAHGPVTVSVAGVATAGDFADGVYARSFGAGTDGAVSVMATGPVSTGGFAAAGVLALGSNGPVTVSVAGVTTAGVLSDGVYARSNGVGANGAVGVTVSGDVSTTSVLADGIFVRGVSSSIVITSTGSVSSALAYSIYSYGETIDTVSVFGGLAGMSDLNEGNDAVTFFSTANIAGLTLFDAGLDTDALTFNGLVTNIDADEFVNFETATFTNGAFITSNGVGASLLSAPNGVFIVNGSTLRLGDMDDILGTVTIDATSALLAFGDSPGMNTITGDLNLAGLLDLTDGDPDDQTDVTGQLNGQGGTIALDVSFHPDGPVESDLVTFGGDLTGMALVYVNPVAAAAPPGAPPPLISLGGAALADIELATPVEVDGLFFGLEQIGGSYFLDVDGVTTEVAGALALSAAFAPINRDLFGDLGARIGTGDALRRPGMADGGAGVWARGGGTFHDGEAGEGTAGVDFDMTHFFVQLGVDAFRAETAGGAVVGAVMVQYGQSDGDVDQDGVGPSTDFNIDSYGAGIDLTWYAGDGDTYVDLAGMVNWHDIDVAGQDTDAMSYTVGLEAGTRFPAGGALSVAPMGQLVYSRADMDDLSLPSVLNGSSAVSVDNPESLEARASVMLELGLGGGSSVQFGGGIAYELLGESTTSFGNSEVDTDFGGLSSEVMARGQFRVSETVTAFGDVRGRKAFGSDGVDSIGGLIGIRIDF